MKPALEALLEAYDAFEQADGRSRKKACHVFYRARLEEASAETGHSTEQLERAVRMKYDRWIRAQQKPPTLPPSA